MTAEETQLRDALADAFPAPAAAPVHLHSQLAARAIESDSKRARRIARRRQIRFGLAWATACAAAVALVVAWPTVAAARALRQMTAAMEDARSAHSVTWRIEENGQKTKVGERWYQEGKSRTETPRTVEIYANGVRYVYAPAAQTVRVYKQPGGPAAYNSSGFGIGALARDMARWGRTDKLRDLGETTTDGRRARQVAIEKPNVGERIVLLADPKTDLPFQYDVQIETRDGWKTKQTGDMTYDEPLPARLFAADFPKGTRVIDTAQSREEWREKLARGQMRQAIPGGEIVIRDWQVNAQGDVFVLYTDDSKPLTFPDLKPGEVRPIKLSPDHHDTRLYLRDENGTRYLPHGDLQPYPALIAGRRISPDIWQRYIFGGHPLKGEWWSPANPDASGWTPRRLTLTVSAWYAMHNVNLRRAAFSETISRPACALVPDYMPHMSYGPWQDYEIIAGALRVRARDAKLSAGGDKEKLENALALYKEEMRVEDDAMRESGNVMVHSSTWFAIYEILRDLGRRDEARDALDKAADQDVYHNMSRQIAEARQREGW